MEQYDPEISQLVFGQPSHPIDVPSYIEAALGLIRSEVQRVEWNNRQEEFDPFGNTGASYETEKFKVEAYSWDDTKEQPFNFKWRDFELSWYKYFGRGMSMSREMTPEECAQMLDDCLESTRAKDKPIL